MDIFFHVKQAPPGDLLLNFGGIISTCEVAADLEFIEIKFSTAWKFNIGPENKPSQKESNISNLPTINHHF